MQGKNEVFSLDATSPGLPKGISRCNMTRIEGISQNRTENARTISFQSSFKSLEENEHAKEKKQRNLPHE